MEAPDSIVVTRKTRFAFELNHPASERNANSVGKTSTHFSLFSNAECTQTTVKTKQCDPRSRQFFFKLRHLIFVTKNSKRTEVFWAALVTDWNKWKAGLNNLQSFR